MESNSLSLSPSMESSEKAWNLPPTLGRFLGSDHPARLVVGPFGSGKSTACVLEFLRRAKEQRAFRGLRNTRFAAIRNTYPELRDTTRKTFEQVIPAELGSWKEQEFKFQMRFEDVNCEIMFRSLDRPEDVKKLLSLELTGAYINEWREIPQEIFEGLTGRIDRYPALADDGGQTWSGIWGDSNPWHPTHWIPTLLRKYPNTIRLFRQPGGRSPQAENRENLKAGYYERMMVGKDRDWISVYVDGEDATATEGSIYGRWLAAVRSGGGLRNFQHPNDEVLTAWDFGIADSMAIWCFRFNERRGVDVIDWYENSGYGLPHYFDWMASRPYAYLLHILPHDGRNRSWHSGRSARELFIERFGHAVRVLPPLDVEDGIGAGRWLLEQATTRFHARCDEVPKDSDLSGFATLAEYKYARDEKNKCFSKLPLHNFASHSADAYRTLAQVVKYGEMVTRPEVKPPQPKVGPTDRAWNLDQLFEDNEQDRSGRRRI